jgi:drug/metabolite transporter (DMT)-like permease
MEVLGVGLALLAAIMFAVGIALQAADAREVDPSQGLKAGLLWRLLRRPRWLIGTVIGTAAWGVQALALLEAPLTVVQPALTFSLIVLLALGSRTLNEPVGLLEYLGAAAIVAGVALVTILTPSEQNIDASSAMLTVMTVAFAVVSFAPWIVKPFGIRSGMLTIIAAGVAFAWAALALKLLSDDLSPLFLSGAIIWFAAWAVAGVVSLLLEQTAYQTHPATQVAPVVFVLQTLLPVLLEPALGQPWDHPLGIAGALVLVVAGAAFLGRSRAVGGLVQASATS